MKETSLPLIAVRFFVTGALVIGFWRAASGSLAEASRLPEKLGVITYNVQFLPGIASIKNERKKPIYRATQIAREVSRFDIIGLQETFHTRHRRILMEELRRLWRGTLNHVASPRPADRYTSGGCLILTRFPIVRSASTVYRFFSKPEDYGLRADGFAAKGAIFARIQVGAQKNDRILEVVVTHLEAREDELRPQQYKELVDFIGAVADPKVPLLIMGDFNTNGVPRYWEDPESQYCILMKNLRSVRPEGGVVDLWRLLKGDTPGNTTDQESILTGKRIDYIFLANPAGKGPRLRPVSVRVNTFPDPEVEFLSDHNAVEAELEWVPSN